MEQPATLRSTHALIHQLYGEEPQIIVSFSDPDVLLTKVYFPQGHTIQVCQLHVRKCPPKFPSALNWYGVTCRQPGQPPHWISEMLESLPDCTTAAPVKQSSESSPDNHGAVDDTAVGSQDDKRHTPTPPQEAPGSEMPALNNAPSAGTTEAVPRDTLASQAFI